MTPAEVLAAAADKLDALAEAAIDGPWRPHDTHLTLGGHTATVMRGEGNDVDLVAWLPTFSDSPWGQERKAWGTSEYIAAMNPLVGKALAELFRMEFARIDATEKVHPPYRPDPEVLALARLIIGGES